MTKTLNASLLTAAKDALRCILRAIMRIHDGKVETFEQRKDLMDDLSVSRDALIRVFTRIFEERVAHDRAKLHRIKKER